MEDLQNYLIQIGFSALEAQIYLALLDHGMLSAYQLAKTIDIARPSIYNALGNMEKKGMVEVVPNSTVLYIAQKPEILLNKIESEHTRSMQQAKEQLHNFCETRYEEQVATVQNFEIVAGKARDMIRNAKKEIYINTDMNLDFLKEEMETAISAGIRIVVFSFFDIVLPVDGVELFTHHRMMEKDHIPTRLLVVVDEELVLIADAQTNRGNWKGIITNNRLMIKIISEHIHNDIYLLKIYGRIGDSMYGEELWVDTAFEQREKGKLSY